MPAKILVINGHGSKISGKSVTIDAAHAIVTPGSAAESYSLSFDDQTKHLEQQTCRGKIWQITDEQGDDVQWHYNTDVVSDIAISPLKSSFNFDSFVNDLEQNKTGWEGLTDPPHDPYARGVLVVRFDGEIVKLEGKDLKNFILEYEGPPQGIRFEPIFFCDKELGKVKPLGRTTLSAIYEGVQLIDEFKAVDTAIVVATCSPDSKEMKGITVQTGRPAMSFNKLFETQLRTSAAERLIDAVEFEAKAKTDELEPISVGKLTGRMIIYPGTISDIAIAEGKKGAMATANINDLVKMAGYDFNDDVTAAVEVTERGRLTPPGQAFATTHAAQDLKQSHNIDTIEVLSTPGDKSRNLEGMYYDALVHSKELDYIIFPSKAGTRNYDECARFAINAFRRFIQDYPESTLKVIFATENNQKAISSYTDYAQLVKTEMLTDFEAITSTLVQGPRQKTQATKDLETICKAILAAPESVTCQRNFLDEIEVKVYGVTYNLTSILKNNADFEQLNFSDEEIHAYVDFLQKGVQNNPELIEYPSYFPTEEMYNRRDPSGRHADLNYSEKLAITIYSGDQMYGVVNEFLRSDGQSPAYKPLTEDELSGIVKETLLVSAIATRGLSKIATRGLDVVAPPATMPQSQFSPVIHEPTLRVEKKSPFNLKRKQDIKESKLTLQKGFTSATERTDAERLFESARPVKLVINTPRNMTLTAQHVAELCTNPTEREVMHAPGKEFKYYHYQEQGEQVALYGMPVRTIESEQQYEYARIRQELINDIAAMIMEYKMQDVDVYLDVRVMDEVVAHMLKWLKIINVSQDELKLFHSIYNKINISPQRSTDLWQGLQAVQVEKDAIGDALSHAAMVDHVEFIKKVIENYPDISLDFPDKPLLNEAVQAGSVNVVRFLLERQGKLTEQEETALLNRAIKYNQFAVVRLFVAKGYSITNELPDQLSPIKTALYSDNPSLFDALLSERTAADIVREVLKLSEADKRRTLIYAFSHPEFVKAVFSPDFISNVVGDNTEQQRALKAEMAFCGVESGFITDIGFFYPEKLSDEDLLAILKYYLKLSAGGLRAIDTVMIGMRNYFTAQVTEEDKIPNSFTELFDLIFASDWFARQNIEIRANLILQVVKTVAKHEWSAKWLFPACKQDPAMISQVRELPAELQAEIFKLAVKNEELQLAMKLWQPNMQKYVAQEFYVAFAANDADALKFFADLGMDATIKNAQQENLLHLAVRKADLTTVQKLLSFSPPLDVNEQSFSGATPLTLALDKDKTGKIVMLFLQYLKMDAGNQQELFDQMFRLLMAYDLSFEDKLPLFTEFFGKFSEADFSTCLTKFILDTNDLTKIKLFDLFLSLNDPRFFRQALKSGIDEETVEERVGILFRAMCTRMDPEIYHQFFKLLLNSNAVLLVPEQNKATLRRLDTWLEIALTKLIDDLPVDDPIRADYITQLKNPSSSIVKFFNSMYGHSPTLFSSKNETPLDRVLAHLYPTGDIEAKPDGPG